MATSGVVVVAGQKVAPRPHHVGQTVTVHVSETTPALPLDEDTRVVRRTTEQLIHSIKGQRPLSTDTSVS